MEVLEQDSTIEVQDNLTILSPSYPTDTAMIFYPGAKVEAEAYLPLLDQIRKTGVTCILVHMRQKKSLPSFRSTSTGT